MVSDYIHQSLNVWKQVSNAKTVIFWNIFQSFPSFFFQSLQADQRVLKDLMSEKLPRLTAHLEALKVDVSLITVEWFLVLFVESLPTRILFKVWDAFLYEGIKVP